MRKLYENFHIFHLQKRLVSAETIRGNTVAADIIIRCMSHCNPRLVPTTYKKRLVLQTDAPTGSTTINERLSKIILVR